MTNNVTVSIYGLGGFGYAMLKHLDAKSDPQLTIRAYDRKKDLLEQLQYHRKHSLLHQDAYISDNIQLATSTSQLVDQVDVLVLAVSSEATTQIIQELKPDLPDNLIIVNTAKALERHTGQRLSEIVKQQLKGQVFTYAMLSGGTIADDLFRHEPLGVDLACQDPGATELLKSVFESSNLTVYPTTDIIGVEYAGAFKNIVAIIAGLVNGLGFSYGSETHLISRLAYDIGQVCVNNYGASAQTFAIGSQSWGNDLWMSCTGNTRNREFGTLLGKGLPVDQALAIFAADRKTVEGVNTLTTLQAMTDIKSIKLIELLYELIVTQSVTVGHLRDYIHTGRQWWSARRSALK